MAGGQGLSLTVYVVKSYNFIRFWAPNVAKPHTITGIGAMDVIKAYIYTSVGAMDAAKLFTNLLSLGPWISPAAINS